jgi:hypothetical protein
MNLEEDLYMTRRTTNTMRITPDSLRCALFITASIIGAMGASVPTAHAQDKGHAPVMHIGGLQWDGPVELAVQAAEEVMKAPC